MQTGALIDWRDHTDLARQRVNELLASSRSLRSLVSRRDLYCQHLRVLIECSKIDPENIRVSFENYAMGAMIKQTQELILNAQGLLRKDGDHPLINDESLLYEIDDERPIDTLIQWERDQRVRVIVSTLSARDQDLVRCVLIEDESHQSYADRNGVSRQRVGQVLQYVTNTIRNRLSDAGITSTNRLGAA